MSDKLDFQVFFEEKDAEKPLPLGELAPKVTERARTLTERNRRSDSIALSKNLLIAA